ncbi:MAG: phage tail tape measure protein [Lachnospiraceae bacterium]|nr:phage tail tape measure protein [Lachnospiraceae bacterium]
MTNNNYINKIGMDTSETQRGLKEINASLKDLKASVQYVTIASKDYNSKLVLLNKIIDENVDKEKLLEKEYNKLINTKGADLIATTKAHEALEKQRTATALAREDLKKFTEAHEKASKAEDIHTVKLDYLSRAVYDLTKALAEKACKALVDFTKETINTGMQFESAFAGVKKVTSGTEEDFKKLETEIRKTALEKPISADQLASIYQMGSQLGIAKDGLKDFSNAIIDLAKTSDLTEEAGATMIAQYANVTGLKPEEYRKFASTLSYLGSTTATTESTIMDFASRISGSAKLIGMSHQEILALSTALGSVGIKAEMGGSAISKIMNSIDVAVDKNSKELQTWAQCSCTVRKQATENKR